MRDYAVANCELGYECTTKTEITLRHSLSLCPSVSDSRGCHNDSTSLFSSTSIAFTVVGMQRGYNNAAATGYSTRDDWSCHTCTAYMYGVHVRCTCMIVQTPLSLAVICHILRAA